MASEEEERIEEENAILRRKLLALRRLAKAKDNEIMRLAAVYLSKHVQPSDERKRRAPSGTGGIPPKADSLVVRSVSEHDRRGRAGKPPAGAARPSAGSFSSSDVGSSGSNDDADEAALKANMASAREGLAAAAGVALASTDFDEPDEVEGPLDSDGLPMAANSTVQYFPPFDPDAGRTDAVLYKLPTDASWGLEFVFGEDQTPVVASISDDSPGSRSVQIAVGMKVYSINGESTVGCGAQKLMTIMKKKVTPRQSLCYSQGLLGKSKKTVTGTFEVSDSLVPEIAGGEVATQADTLRAQKVAWWSRTGPRKKSSAKGESTTTSSASALPPATSDDSGMKATPEHPTFVLTRPLRPVSKRRGSANDESAKASLPALKVDTDSQATPFSADGKRLKNRVSLAHSSKDAHFANKRSSIEGGETTNPLFGMSSEELAEEEQSGASSGSDSDSVAMADPGTTRASPPPQSPAPPKRQTLPDSDYFLSMINHGVAENDELRDDEGCRYHWANGLAVYRESDVEALGNERPGTPTGVQSFGPGGSAGASGRHMMIEDDGDTKFGFSGSDVDDVDDLDAAPKKTSMLHGLFRSKRKSEPPPVEREREAAVDDGDRDTTFGFGDYAEDE